MDESVFRGWDSFYVIIGSAAAGLIGLLFVVVTLTASFDRERVMRAIDIYTTPVAVHFALVLTTCAIAMVPRASPRRDRRSLRPLRRRRLVQCRQILDWHPPGNARR